MEKDVSDRVEDIGDKIYRYVEMLTDQDAAPKVTGMILDLEFKYIMQAVCNYDALWDKIDEAIAMLDEEDEEGHGGADHV